MENDKIYFYFICAISTGLKPSQTRYSVYELEMLCVQWALDKLAIYLFGGHPVMVLMDHKALEGLEQKALNPWMTDRERRILEDIMRFNIKIIYIPQASNLIADYMSRIQHKTKEAPEHPRHATNTPVAVVVHEGAVIDIKLMPLIEIANNDQNYQATIKDGGRRTESPQPPSTPTTQPRSTGRSGDT